MGGVGGWLTPTTYIQLNGAGSIEKYKCDLQEKLESLSSVESMCCFNPQCQDVSHSSERDSLVLDIFRSVIETSHSNGRW